MERVRIVTDSGADLPNELAERFGITIVPLIVTFGAESYNDTDLSRAEFWRLARGPVSPMTSQPPSGVFRDTFRPLVDSGDRVLCLTITGRHSGTFGSAWTAARAFGDRVVVVDSLSLSLGQGVQALRAAQMSQDGAEMNEILRALDSMQQQSHIAILFDTVDVLRRGGRAATLMPAIDRLLKTIRLKPLVTLVDGELKLLCVARSYRKGVRRVVQEIVRVAPLEAVAVLHTRRPGIAQEVADDLGRLTNIPRGEILVVEAGAVIAAHAGEGVIAALGVAGS